MTQFIKPVKPILSVNEELTISQLSQRLKGVVEDNFGYVRVRGEIGRVTRPASGHTYLDLKDDKAVLSGVIWKGQLSKLQYKPEQGVEVVCTGRLTTYASQSRYQITIEAMAIAGQGALMALLEKKRKEFAAAGLFDQARKQPLPYLPERIGVITSPSGAVIRDILHRIEARFARPVLIWPVQVQGEKCADEVTAAIDGFNALDKKIRPDLLIIARGGGSLEDLWPFNEEQIIHAVSRSELPVISAIGHETDHTLLDLVADLRAPTPTAAAEIAVPVRADLLATLHDLARRQIKAGHLTLNLRQERLDDMNRRLKRGVEFINIIQQRLDDMIMRLPAIAQRQLDLYRERLSRHAAWLSVKRLTGLLDNSQQIVRHLHRQASNVISARLHEKEKSLQALARMLDAVSYHHILERGFALVRDEHDRPIQSAAQTHEGQNLKIEFARRQKIHVRRIDKTEGQQKSLFDSPEKSHKSYD